MDWIIEKYSLLNLKTKLKNYKRISELAILLFFAVIYFFLKHAGIPQFNYEFAKSYREIDWEKFVPEKTRPVKRQSVPVSTTPDVETIESSSELTEITDFLKNDISTVLNQQPEKSLLETPVETDMSQKNKLQIDNSDVSIPLEQQNYLESETTDLLPHTFVEPSNVGPAVAINDVSIQTSNMGRKQFTPKQKNPSIATDKLIPESGEIHIPLISQDKVSDKPDISVLLDKLMSWMKNHPSAFNDVTESFMRYEPGNLTSKVEFRFSDRRFELYLLYKPNIREIRICLVEGDQSTMLIDSGFKKTSNYLRTGSVKRALDGSIFAFGTSQRPASTRTTSEFYRFFLSWWEQAKKEVEN